ncbi:hypothetical protein ACEPAG_1835 [Sanghuangporus baumii]
MNSVVDGPGHCRGQWQNRVPGVIGVWCGHGQSSSHAGPPQSASLSTRHRHGTVVRMVRLQPRKCYNGESLTEGNILAAGSLNLQAVQACMVTNLASSVGGLTWILWDWRLERKWSAGGFCSGAIYGLVAITPGSGIVGALAAIAFGVLSGTACDFATQLKFIFGYNETLDIFAVHASGGNVGNICTALFAQASVAGFDGITEIDGGWFYHHWVQLSYQIADSAAGFGYSFVLTTIILCILHFIPGLRLRCNEETEILGVDDAELGEFAYDYVGLDAEIGAGLPHSASGPGGPHADVSPFGAVGGGREPPHLHVPAKRDSSSDGGEKTAT